MIRSLTLRQPGKTSPCCSGQCPQVSRMPLLLPCSCQTHSLLFLIPHPGTAGGEAQQNDIKVLRRELELKKTKLNELREEARRKELLLSRNQDDNTDASRMTPGELSEEQAFVRELQDEMKRIDEELVEAEAKNRLYYLLGERTRWAARFNPDTR